jgi:NAD-reducing hydrogenase large subunit
VDGFASFPSNFMSLVRAADGALDLYHGNLRALDRRAAVIFDQLEYSKYYREDRRGRARRGPT